MPVGILLVLATVACSQEVRSDYDHHVNFSRYKTYSWAKVETPDSIWDQRVNEAIDRTLAAKGWAQVPSGGSISVVAVGTTMKSPRCGPSTPGSVAGAGAALVTRPPNVENHEVGTLIVDIFDTSTKSLIWRNSARDVLSSKPEKNIKKLDKAVQKMFEHFPPELG
jgi:hypothetical protein